MHVLRPWIQSVGIVALLGGCGGKTVAPAPTTPATPVVPATPAAQREPLGPFFYELQGKTGPVYLLGTIHLAVSAKNDLAPVVWQRITSCKKIVLEIDPTKASPFKMLARAIDMKQTPMDQQLGPARWAKLTTIITDLPPKTMKIMKPWMLGTLLSLQGADATKSMELELVAWANDNGVEVGALESVEDQLAALEGSMTLDDLKEAIDDHEDNVKSLADLIAAYRAGDLTRFLELFEQDADDMKKKDEPDLMLRGRNEKWIPKIETLLEGGSVCIAVGAAHLYGEYGVLELLEKQGYEATRLPGTNRPVPAKEPTDTALPTPANPAPPTSLLAPELPLAAAELASSLLQ